MTKQKIEVYSSDLSKDAQANSSASMLSNSLDKKVDENVIAIETLVGYNTIGFKVVPLGVDSKTPAVKSTAEIYNDIAYWTTNLIKEEHHRFKNVATTFGRTYIKNENGQYLYLHGLDIDSDNVLRILFDLVEELKSKTFITKSKKDCGYHVYWLSHKQNSSVGVSKCKIGYEFEIKADNSLGLCNLPPSRHRDDPDFRYQSIGRKDKIVIDDTLYDKILNLLSNECLVNSSSNGKSNEHAAADDISNGKASKSNSIYTVLEDAEIEDIICCIKGNYIKGYRHNLVFGLSGLLFKNNISLSSAEKLVSCLCDYTCDEEKASRLSVVSNTYLKGLEGHEIKGKSQLEELFIRIHNAGNSDDRSSQKESIEVLKKLEVALKKTHEDKDKEEENDDKKSSTSPTKVIVQLAEENAIFFFKDQYDIAYAKVKVADHNEIIALGSSRFEYYLSKLYYDYTEGESIVGQESLNNAIRILLAKTLFEGPIVNLSLRISWGDNEREIYYDLVDSQWRCIRVTQLGWEIIQDPPILFIRFNQKAQVEPDRNYSGDIFDRYLDLMHITTPDNRLLIKVWTVAAFIPDIPHPISIPYGEKGSVKTTYCKFQKRLIDPDKIELLTIPQEKSEFVQQQYHNYLSVYDNIKTIPYWFSDEVCKAITGIGSSKRRLYTDDEDVIYSYKRLLIINGINNSLTEPDALDRSILKEFERIADDQRKEESKVEAEFEEMKLKLLGYIFDVLVKSLGTKPTVQLHNLPRMADFTVWGEAIARAMGYRPMDFIEVYYRNIGRQNVEVIESNPLAQAIEKFVQSWYKEGAEACWQSPTSKVLERLNKLAQAYGVDTSNKLWPKAANSLTKRLRPILSNLREGLGINVIISRNTSGKNKNTSTLRIWKQPPPPPRSQPDQNQAQNEDNIGGGSWDSKIVTSTSQQVSTPETITICAQIPESGDSGGYITTLQEEELCSCPIPSNYVAFDFEWSSCPEESNNIDTQIIAAAFVDTNGNSTVLHLSDFTNTENPEHELLTSINHELLKYDFSIGWYSTGVAKYHEDTQEYLDGVDSDLAILHNRCSANGIDSIVDFNNAGIPYIRGQKHIDLYSVYGKSMVQTAIFKNSYRTLKLDEVSKAVLVDDIGEGKYKGLTGSDFQTLPVEEQKKYVLKDAELVIQLSKHNNGEVLDAMKAISQLTGLAFEKVCRTGLSTWWAAIFDNMVPRGECEALTLPSSNRKKQEQTELSYTGGSVLQPRKGPYHDLIVVDVASLYPSMAILHNISFDTINCECCKGHLESRVSLDITKDCKLEKEYWICRQKTGTFPKKLKIFKEERLKQKKLKNNVKQLALKILINGGYGVFGNHYFKYYDPRVAELIAAYGRHTLSRMQDIAINTGFEIVYGDTDSLFIHHKNYDNENTNIQEIISKFQYECNKQLGIEVEHAKTYQKAIISDKKKHYIGWTGIDRKELDIVGMEGDKNDRPIWINTIFRQIAHDIFDNKNPLISLKGAISDLEAGNVSPDLLKRSKRLSKNPKEYENENDRMRKIGLAIGARKGDVIEYFESDNKEGYSLNPQEISISKYKEMVLKAVKDILEIAGYGIAAIEQDFILNSKDDHMAKPPRGVVGMLANQFAKSSS
jgi:DNA polymerase elongation subunit (family B)